MHAKQHGFSLVELLVVVAIIAILAGVLVPALAGARESARIVTCQSTLRQWGVALQMYAATNADAMPRRGQGVLITTVLNRPEDWFNALPPLMNMPDYNTLSSQGKRPQAGDHSIWVCPDAIDNAAPNFFTYGMNMRLSTWFTPNPEHINRIDDPLTQVFMSEGNGGYGSLLPAPHDYTPVARHQGRVNVSFVDGHVAAFTGVYVGCGVGDPNRPDVRWVVPDDPWPGPTN